jgi:hypothetical protein
LLAERLLPLPHHEVYINSLHKEILKWKKRSFSLSPQILLCHERTFCVQIKEKKTDQAFVKKKSMEVSHKYLI